MKNEKLVEIRSEKVKNIIEKMPSALIKYGIAVISITVITLLAIVVFIPYPESVYIDLIVKKYDNNLIYSEGIVPYQYITLIETKTSVLCEFEGYTTNKMEKFTISKISPKIISIKNNDYFKVLIVGSCNLDIKEKTKGKCQILLSNKTLLKRILQTF